MPTFAWDMKWQSNCQMKMRPNHLMNENDMQLSPDTGKAHETFGPNSASYFSVAQK